MDPNQDTVRSMAELLSDSGHDDSYVIQTSTTSAALDNSVFNHDIEDDLKEIGADVAASKGSNPNFQRNASRRGSKRSLKSRLSVNSPLPKPQQLVLKVVVLGMFLFITASLIVIGIYHKAAVSQYLKVKHFQLDMSDGTVTVRDKNGQDALKLVLMSHSWPLPPPYDCTTQGTERESLCLRWHGVILLQVFLRSSSGQEWLEVRWRAENGFRPGDCILVSDGAWYGGGTLEHPSYPLKANLSTTNFVTSLQASQGFGPYIYPMWFTHTASITFDPSNKLQIGLGDVSLQYSTNLMERALPKELESGQFVCVTSHKSEDNDFTTLAYNITFGSDINHVQEATRKAMNRNMAASIDVLDVLEKPVWAIPATDQLSENLILNYAEQVYNSSLEKGVLVIPVGWEPTLGEMKFDPDKFPNAKRMVKLLHDMGFEVRLTVHSLVSVHANVYQHYSMKNYLVMDNSKTYITAMWGHDCGIEFARPCLSSVLNILNPDARHLFKEQLSTLKTQYNIDSLHFMAGDAKSLLPVTAEFSRNKYSEEYVELAASLDMFTTVEVGYCTQQIAVVNTLPHVTPSSNMLQTTVGHLLSMASIGYDTLITVPGTDWTEFAKTSSEAKVYNLFSGWMKLASFMPLQQLSLPPATSFSDDIVEELKTIQTLHDTMWRLYIRPLLTSGQPVIRPVWSLDPTQSDALICNHEFLIDRSVLVIVLQNNSTAYIPTGVWKSGENSSLVLEGPATHTIPETYGLVTYFVRTNDIEK